MGGTQSINTAAEGVVTKRGREMANRKRAKARAAAAARLEKENARAERSRDRWGRRARQGADVNALKSAVRGGARQVKAKAASAVRVKKLQRMAPGAARERAEARLAQQAARRRQREQQQALLRRKRREGVAAKRAVARQAKEEKRAVGWADRELAREVLRRGGSVVQARKREKARGKRADARAARDVLRRGRSAVRAKRERANVARAARAAREEEDDAPGVYSRSASAPRPSRTPGRVPQALRSRSASAPPRPSRTPGRVPQALRSRSAPRRVSKKTPEEGPLARIKRLARERVAARALAYPSAEAARKAAGAESLARKAAAKAATMDRKMAKRERLRGEKKAIMNNLRAEKKAVRVAAKAAAKVAAKAAAKAGKARARAEGLAGITERQGGSGFVAALQRVANSDGVVDDLRISCARAKNGSARPYAYQEFVSYAVTPGSPVARLLCVHRTGAGKTLTMVRVLDNFFDDSRTKVVVFPNTAIAQNFYSQLLEYDNRYRDYLYRVMDPRLLEVLKKNDKSHPDYKKVLEEAQDRLGLVGELRKRRGDSAAPRLAGPLRAYSYAQLGGKSVMRGADPVLRAPKGTNPFDNRIVLMDEMHNLVAPGHGCGAFCDNYLALQECIAESRNTVLVGFTATPMPVDAGSGDLLMASVRGMQPGKFAELEPLARHYLSVKEDEEDDEEDEPRGGRRDKKKAKARGSSGARVDAIAEQLVKKRTQWEGFVSYFYSQPPALFPDYIPMPCVQVPMSEAMMKNYDEKFKSAADAFARQHDGKKLPAFTENVSVDDKIVERMQAYCNIALGPTMIASKVMKFLQANGYDYNEVASKFEAVANKLLNTNGKALVIVDRKNSMVALVEILNQMAKERAGANCPIGKCVAKLLNSNAKVDEEGNTIDSSENVETLNAFNSDNNRYGERIKILVIDARTYSEGVSFFGVTELHIVNPSTKYSVHLQRLGRVFRSCRQVPQFAVMAKVKPQSSAAVRKNIAKAEKARAIARKSGYGSKTRRKLENKARRAEKKAGFGGDLVKDEKMVRQKIRVYMYISFDEEGRMTADQYAMAKLLRSKDEFKQQMKFFEAVAIDKGLYDRWESRFKTGDEPICTSQNYVDEYDYDEEEGKREDARRASAKKRKELKAAEEVEKRNARAAARRG